MMRRNKTFKELVKITMAFNSMPPNDNHHRFNIFAILCYVWDHFNISWTPYYYSKQYLCDVTVCNRVINVIGRHSKKRLLMHTFQMLYISFLLCQLGYNGFINKYCDTCTNYSDKSVFFIEDFQARWKVSVWQSLKLLLVFDNIRGPHKQKNSINFVFFLVTLTNFVQKLYYLLRRQRDHYTILDNNNLIINNNKLLSSGNYDDNVIGIYNCEQSRKLQRLLRSSISLIRDTRVETVILYTEFCCRPQLLLREWLQFVTTYDKKEQKIDEKLLKSYPILAYHPNKRQMVKEFDTIVLLSKDNQHLFHGAAYKRLAVLFMILVFSLPFVTNLIVISLNILVNFHTDLETSTKKNGIIIATIGELGAFLYGSSIVFSNFFQLIDTAHLVLCCLILRSRLQMFNVKVKHFIQQCRIYQRSPRFLDLRDNYMLQSKLATMRLQSLSYESYLYSQASQKNINDAYSQRRIHAFMSRAIKEMSDECETLVENLHQLLREFKELKNYFTVRTGISLFFASVITMVIIVGLSDLSRHHEPVNYIIYIIIMMASITDITCLLSFPAMLSHNVSAR